MYFSSLLLTLLLLKSRENMTVETRWAVIECRVVAVAGRYFYRRRHGEADVGTVHGSMGGRRASVNGARDPCYGEKLASARLGRRRNNFASANGGI